jgi:hypothetical protein
MSRWAGSYTERELNRHFQFPVMPDFNSLAFNYDALAPVQCRTETYTLRELLAADPRDAHKHKLLCKAIEMTEQDYFQQMQEDAAQPEKPQPQEPKPVPQNPPASGAVASFERDLNVFKAVCSKATMDPRVQKFCVENFYRGVIAAVTAIAEGGPGSLAQLSVFLMVQSLLEITKE